MANVILELELNGMLVTNGRDGNRNEAIGKFLKAHKVSYTRYTKYSDYNKKANNFRISILVGRFTNSGHAFCVLKVSNKLYTINFSNNDTSLKLISWYNIKKVFSEAYCVK